MLPRLLLAVVLVSGCGRTEVYPRKIPGFICGDKIVSGAEQCDDGNATNGDGCDTDCTWTCGAAADCSDGNACNGAETCTAGLLFVIVLTYLLLVRAFRSLLLPLKAVILNLVSLGAAYGIIVFIFQLGHGSQAIWGVPSTGSIISWIPLMIFAFLYGLSMDYEVFMLTRMREAYDDTGDTPRSIQLGLARTGKLVTSAALVLMFAFFVLSTSPGTDIKQFGIGLAAGIIFDATVIRALLVPAIMRLMGKWNWWLPPWADRLLRVAPSRG